MSYLPTDTPGPTDTPMATNTHSLRKLRRPLAGHRGVAEEAHGRGRAPPARGGARLRRGPRQPAAARGRGAVHGGTAPTSAPAIASNPLLGILGNSGWGSLIVALPSLLFIGFVTFMILAILGIIIGGVYVKLLYKKQ